MQKCLLLLALGFTLNASPALATTIMTEEIADEGLAFNTAIATQHGHAISDTWNNPDWDFNDGHYSGSPTTPYIFYGMQRDGYSVEKGLMPMGISGRSMFLTHREEGVDYDPLTLFSPLNGQAVSFNPDTQPAGSPSIAFGHHPGIEYGLVFKFDQPIDAFGLEFNVEAHNSANEATFASLYYSLDGGPAQLVSGPFDLTAASNGNSTEFSSFIGIIEHDRPFRTISFFTDGPRGEDGALLSFYNAYIGGTIHYNLAASPVPEAPVGWLLLAGGLGMFCMRKYCVSRAIYA